MRGYPNPNIDNKNDGFLGYENDEIINIELVPPSKAPTPLFSIFDAFPLLAKVFKEAHPWNIS